MEVVRVDQCQLGARSKAPTTLLALRCGSLRSLLGAVRGGGLCDHDAHPEVLVGRAPDGTWRTAQKRAYPPRLCSLLAEALLRCPLSRYAKGPPGPELPDKFGPFHVPLGEGSGAEGWRDLDSAALRGVARRGEGQAEGARAKRRLEELLALSADDAILGDLMAQGHVPAPGVQLDGRGRATAGPSVPRGGGAPGHLPALLPRPPEFG